MKDYKQLMPGIALCFMLAVPAWLLGEAFPLIGSPVFGILLGMMLVIICPALLTRNLSWDTERCKGRNGRLETGVKYTSKKLLQYSIILLGFGMNLFQVLQVGVQSLSVILTTLTAAFVTAYFVGKLLRLNGNMTVLIGVGTSICGGSAIAATAPVIKAGDEEIAQAISTIFLFNILAVFLFPAAGMALGLSDQGFGMWAGTAVNDTSSVVATGAAWSNAVGNNTALEFATIVKLTRTLMIVPITLSLALYTAWRENGSQPQNDERFSVGKVFPWFVVGFAATSIVNTFFAIPDFSHVAVVVGKFMIVMAMAAIGLNTNLIKLVTNGVRPIFLGVCCWLAVAGASLAVQKITQLW